MNDLIQIRSFELLLYCGVLPEETVRQQPFRFDLDIEADLRRPSKSDELADTVDYGEVLKTLAKTLEAERFDLLERLAGRTAELVLINPSVSAVTVAVSKLRPPVPYHVASTGVKIRRER